MITRNQNPKNHLMVSNSNPYYYEVRNEDGERYCHCGDISDVYRLLEANPNFTYEKIYLPHPPTTVDVPHTIMDPDLELPEQKILPQSEQQPLEL